MIDDKIEQAGEDNRWVEDGIYNVTNIDFISRNGMGNNDKEVKKFITKYPEFWVASAYETEQEILLASKPEKFKGEQHGSEFNYGSTNILTNCPKAILILAQND